MGIVEILILFGLILVVFAVMVTDNVIETDQERYKCFLKKIYNEQASMSTGCKGIPDDKICKNCTYRKNYIKNKKNKENK